MRCYLGLDTSNYTTSVALCTQQGEVVKNIRIPLPVREGQLGLRQSDAGFLHLKNLEGLKERILDNINVTDIAAIGVSSRPRDIEGSYMPCFTVGTAFANVLCNLLDVPMYAFSHQQGHIAAALYGGNALHYIHAPFIAFHLSGGTTEAVLCRPDGQGSVQTELVAESLDLKAGQLVDRVGAMLNLPFPAGPELDKLAQKSKQQYRVKPVLKGFDCCLSGVENQCNKRLLQGEALADIARFCLDSIGAALCGMTDLLLQKYGTLPLLYAGGVMSNSILSALVKEKYGAACAPAQYSSDNAAGIALLAARRGEMIL